MTCDSFDCLLVTGGVGFIGSGFIWSWIEGRTEGVKVDRIVVVDKMHYSANPANLGGDWDEVNLRENFVRRGNLYVYRMNLTDTAGLVNVMRKQGVDGIVHQAARSHVDESYLEPMEYVADNVAGTTSLMEAARIQGAGSLKKIIHVSTDEVQGDHFGEEGFEENRMLMPTNPYSATKAAAEMMVRAQHVSQKLPIVITRGNNVQGPRQHNEKLIPRFTSLLLAGRRCTIAGSGEQTRAFVHVDDVATAFWVMLERGVVGEVQNIGSPDERSVLEVQEAMCGIFGVDVGEMREAIPDRAFNDTRYFVNDRKLRALGYEPRVGFDEGLRATVEWQRERAADYCGLE